ncbi:MAG: tyrosine-type recombinase/integrase [Cytophagales bacterium]|nr:tyrosine-type recombinase/integrase [Cytophagales bacterium]
MKMQGGHFLAYAEKFKIWLHRLGYASTTVSSYTRQLSTFLAWLVSHEIFSFDSIQQSDLEKYCESLHTRKNRLFGGALSSSYIQSHINVLGLLDQYLQLTGQGKILRGAIRVEQGLKKHRTLLSQQEIQQLYEATEDSVLGYRDRAILAIYYGCGLRSSEGERIKLNHIHYEKGLLEVLAGKNYQGRYVPLSAGVAKDLQAYQHYSRPYLGSKSQESLLLGLLGRPLKGSSMGKRIQKLVELAGIPKQISLHSLRHSIATHLLQQGMPLEQISRFLGHTSLDSTQFYTRLAEEMHA